MNHSRPILFIDFDRTLFDTDLFYDWLGEARMERILGVTMGTIAPPDFAAMLYPDAIDFLEEMRKDFRLVILTFETNHGLQRKKLQISGVVPLVDDIIVTGSGKGDEAASYIARIGAPLLGHAFIDDRPDYIADMKTKNPGVRAILIRREGDFPDESDPLGEMADARIRDLSEAKRYLRAG